MGRERLGLRIEQETANGRDVVERVGPGREVEARTGQQLGDPIGDPERRRDAGRAVDRVDEVRDDLVDLIRTFFSLAGRIAAKALIARSIGTDTDEPLRLLGDVGERLGIGRLVVAPVGVSDGRPEERRAVRRRDDVDALRVGQGSGEDDMAQRPAPVPVDQPVLALARPDILKLDSPASFEIRSANSPAALTTNEVSIAPGA